MLEVRIVVTFGKEAEGNNWERQKRGTVLFLNLSSGYMGVFSIEKHKLYTSDLHTFLPICYTSVNIL